MRVYSPSQTEAHLRCPLLRHLAKDRWVPRRIEQRDISAALGEAIAFGLAHYNRPSVLILRPTMEAGTIAAQRAREIQEEILQDGRTLSPHLQGQWDRVPERAEGAVWAYTTLADQSGGLPPGLPVGTTIVHVEKSFGPEGGWARPDLEVNDGLAAIVPYDYKTALSLGGTKGEAARNLEKRIQRFADSHQLYHYAWWRQTLHYYIGHMVLEPVFQFETLRFIVHPETLAIWERGAKQTWADMEAEDWFQRVPAMAATHADQFGECPMKRACFEHHLDPSLMAGDYIQKRAKQYGVEKAQP